MRKYKVIYADPPWKYKEDWGNGSFKHSYPAMDTEDIKKLSVQDICDDECHLYLWVTNPFIKEGLEVCKAWGFEFKTLITWIKTYKDGTPEMGMGYYFRSCTEHIIFGVKGKMKTQNKITKNMFKAINPKGHSKKPDCVYDLIVNSSGDVPRIELFARKRIKGWDCWGDEVESDTALVSNSKGSPLENSFNKDLTATQQVASPKSASQTSLNPDIMRNFSCGKNLKHNGVYFQPNYYCVWTKGRSEREINRTDWHENCHDLVYLQHEHFCGDVEE